MAHTLQEVDAELPQDDLLATKLHMPPPRRDLVQRPRLTDRLSAGLRGPLTLIVAPAGWGKTTLLSDWRAAQREGAPPMAWLALDSEDNDLTRFLGYVITALHTLHPEVGRGLLARLHSSHPPPTDALLTLLLNDLVALTQDAVLVLDDYHVIDAQAVHQALAYLLDHLPPQIHLVIATRADPPLPLARLRARGQLAELRATDLRFTSDEATEFLNRTMGLRLSADDFATLDARTEGWIAGLHLAALSLRDRDPEHRRDFMAAFSGTNRYILDFLADEVFDGQPQDIQRFLLCTSILDRLSGALCDAVATAGAHDGPPSGGRAMLARLGATNLFVVPLDDDRTWYRYHPLFADFLRERLRRKHPDLIPDLHRRAYQWLEGKGLLAQAADHALAAADYEQAARLIEQVIAPTMWQRGELMTLQRWLERLPPALTRTRPRLGLDLAWVVLWSAQIDAIEPRLQDVDHALADNAEARLRLPRATVSAMRGEVAAIRAGLSRQRGETDAAISLASQALADLPRDDRLVRSVTTGLLAGAHLLNGDMVAATETFAQVVSLSRDSVGHTVTLVASGRLVHAQALQGQLRQAATTYQQTLKMATDHGMLATPAIGVAQVGMGEVLRERNDLEVAENLLWQGITLCAGWGGLAEVALDGYRALAHVLQARGNPDGALTVLQEAEAVGRDGNVAQYAARVAVTEAELWLRSARGEVAPPTHWAASREGASSPDSRMDYVGTLERLALARLQMAQGRFDDALRTVTRLLGAAEARGWTRAMVEILVLQALSLQGLGQTPQAMIALARALSLAEPQGYVRLFVDEAAPMVRLLQEARSRGLAPTYVDALLAACGATGMAVGDGAALVEPLSARELELLGFLAAGLSTSEIAAQLFITTGTARNHLKSIYGKLDVHSRLQAVERARALNLL